MNDWPTLPKVRLIYQSSGEVVTGFLDERLNEFRPEDAPHDPTDLHVLLLAQLMGALKVERVDVTEWEGNT